MTNKPWNNEPDYKKFHHLGLPCYLLRNNLGAWCGYVGVSKSHPLYEVEHFEECVFLKDPSEISEDAPGELISTPDAALHVHGGVTFSGWAHREGMKDNRWYFGFHCSHSFDITPHDVENGHPIVSGSAYRDMDFVQNEVENLAEQLVKLDKETMYSGQ